MPVTGADTIAKNIIKYGGGFTKSVNKVMTKVSEIMDKEATKNMSLTDHSLEELASLDHPYAKRHGATGKDLHQPYWQVHKQSGQLLSSKSSGIVEANVTAGVLRSKAYVKLDPNKAPHALNVVYGTSKMIPRPILKGSRENVLVEAKTYITTTLKNLKIELG